MIVCLCAGVSGKKVCELIHNGACTLAEIKRSCGAGTGCGSCIGSLREILKRERKKKVKKPNSRDI